MSLFTLWTLCALPSVALAAVALRRLAGRRDAEEAGSGSLLRSGVSLLIGVVLVLWVILALIALRLS